MHYQQQAGQCRVEFENLPCSEPQSTMSENLHQMRLAPQPGVDNALFSNNSTSTLGWPVRSGTWIKPSPQPHSILAQY